MSRPRPTPRSGPGYSAARRSPSSPSWTRRTGSSTSRRPTSRSSRAFLAPTLFRKAYRAATDPARTRREAVVLRDLMSFRAGAARSFRRARPRHGARGRLLIISLSDQVYQLKLEGVLATSLRLEGYEPVVLTLKNARWAEPYLRSFGVREFVHLEDFLDPEHEADAVRAADAFLAGEPTVQSLKALEF